MPKFHRNYVPGGTYFFTAATYGREPIFASETARRLLGQVMRECNERYPFATDAIVLLPDHMHIIWRLPSGDDDYSRRWAWLKRRFTKQWLAEGAPERRTTTAQRQQRRKGVWQPRYWEHTISDEDDYEQHVNYVHYNPVKHGYVACPHEWPYSSFHRYVRQGHFVREWCCGGSEVRERWIDLATGE